MLTVAFCLPSAQPESTCGRIRAQLRVLGPFATMVEAVAATVEMAEPPAILLPHQGQSADQHQLNGIKNKLRRRELAAKVKRQKKKDKRDRQDTRKKAAEALGSAAPAPLVPQTLESLREPDETTVVASAEGADPATVDEETQWDIEHDEWAEYFAKAYEPKVLITSGDNPHSRTIAFMKELSRIVPRAEPMWRRNASMKQIMKSAIVNQFTDVIVVNEDKRMPNGMIVSHLPDGPTAHFRLSNVKIAKDIKKDWRQISSLRPEVILNNFTTRLGHTVGRMMAALFHYEPEFRGKRCVTFHNQRDYIFFRHHMYEFKSNEKVRLRDMGPRFTLKLRSLQKGTFDSKLGEYEWVISGRRHDMETSRRRFFL
eukprot:maker-scaffold287_size221780-snap-gene-0.22 protein:Tk01893 transcript:maker-scaffold287_size221780-snap-gene-0.22-mRNA-1 annotation:"ribosome production factor 1"